MPDINIVVFSSLDECKSKIRDKGYLNERCVNYFYNNLHSFVDNIIMIRKNLGIIKGFKALYFLYPNGEYDEIKVDKIKNFAKNIIAISKGGYFILVLE